jgi:phosphate transport system substrate-binding protein
MITRSAALTLSFIFAASPLAGCKRNQQSSLTIAGSTSVQPFAERWVEAFRAKHPDAQFHVQGGGSTAGVQSVVDGAAQIGMCSRALKADEAEKAKGIVVARDGIAIVVNKDNPVGDLTLDQIQKIFTSEVTDWKDVGGKEGKITTITREDGSGTRGAFEELALGGKRIAASALVQDSTGALRQMVGSDVNAVGYISLGLVDASVKAIHVGGVAATEAEIDAHKYPLVRPFLFIVKEEPQGVVKELIDFIHGPDGQKITRKEGLLPAAEAK